MIQLYDTIVCLQKGNFYMAKMSKTILPIANERRGDAQKGDIFEKNPVPVEIRFGMRVRELRIERRLPQAVLAHLAQVNRNYLSDVERGKRNVSLRVIASLARALGVEIQDLFTEREV